MYTPFASDTQDINFDIDLKKINKRSVKILQQK